MLRKGEKGNGQEVAAIEANHTFADPETVEQVIAERLAEKRRLETSKTGEAYCCGRSNICDWCQTSLAVSKSNM